MEKNEYKIIAVDFDGTLCAECYPGIGEAIEWCKQHGLTFDAVNDNLEEIKQKYQHNSRKITADIYVDDKAVNGCSGSEW